MQLQTQQGQQQRANIMQKMKGAAGASGIAALAQQMASQGALDAQKAGAMIGDQEAANQAKAAAEASKLQAKELEGAKDARQLQYDKTTNLMSMAAGQAQAAGEAKTAAQQAKGDAITGIGSSLIGAAGIGG